MKKIAYVAAGLICLGLIGYPFYRLTVISLRMDQMADDKWEEYQARKKQQTVLPRESMK